MYIKQALSFNLHKCNIIIPIVMLKQLRLSPM